MENNSETIISDTVIVPPEAIEKKKGSFSASLMPLPTAEEFPRWFAPTLVALALGWAALLQMRESDLAGISVVIVETVYLGLVIAYYQRKSPLDWFGWTLAGSAFFAALWFSIFRSEDMGLYLRLVLLGLNIIFPAYASGVIRQSWDTLRSVWIKWDIFRAFFLTLRPAMQLSTRSLAIMGRSGPTLRYGASVLVLVLIFLFLVPLLVTADPAFAHLVQQFLPEWLYDLDFSRVLWTAWWTLLFVWFVGTLVLSPSRIHPNADIPSAFNPPALSWPIILGGIVALYALYIGVQIQYFFLAADANVYQTFGLTYAEYIHKGFYELLAVSFINIAIAKTSFELSREKDGSPSVIVRLFIAAVVVCAVVIACSGVSRAWHYVGAYGLSIERMLVLYASFLAIAIFIVALFKLVFVRLREAPVAVALAITSFVAFAYTNVESTVASYNIRTQSADKLDAEYILSRLSEDALDEKLWIAQNNPTSVLRTRIDWDCDSQIENAQKAGAPVPTCDREIDVTNQSVFYDWLMDARREANRSNHREPPAWYHANYSAYRLYTDPTILSSYGDKLNHDVGFGDTSNSYSTFSD